MNTFIAPSQFKRYVDEPLAWIEGDRRAVAAANDFLHEANRPPRLAVLFLFSSHGPFDVLPDKQPFQPAAAVDDVYPFTLAQRGRAWNRYLNALHSLDHLLGPLLAEDRLTIVAGDHGEAFLEDGTIGHGVRMTSVQNRTPVVITGATDFHVPNGRTFHADILPTLLDLAGLKCDTDSLHGFNLHNTSAEELDQRCFCSTLFLRPELMVLGPWTTTEQPYAFRAVFDMTSFRFLPLTAIDADGLPSEAADDPSEISMDAALGRWATERFGVNPLSDRRPVQQRLLTFLRHDDAQCKLLAIEMAEEIRGASDSLIDAVSQLSSDSNPEVRIAARDCLVELHRHRASP